MEPVILATCIASAAISAGVVTFHVCLYYHVSARRRWKATFRAKDMELNALQLKYMQAFCTPFIKPSHN